MCRSGCSRWLLIFLTSLSALPCLQASQAFADDTTPPTTPVVIDDGRYTTSTTELHAAWSSSDPETGVAEFRYRIRQQSATGAIVRGWTSASSADSVVATGFLCATGKGSISGLCNGQTYVFEVRARNGGDLWSASGFSDGITVDATPPSTPSVSDDGNVTTTTNQLHFRWTPSTDQESGIAKYRYWIRVGISSPGSAIRRGSIPAERSEITVTDLDLQLGDRYWVELSARNGARLNSERALSDGIDVLSATEIQLTVESRGYDAEEWSSQGGVARFSRFSTVFSQRYGGGNGGRGFNVVTIYPATGEIGPWKGHFDTFISPSEPAKTALVDLLNSIPNGMIVMVAVADEAGLTQYSPDSCTPRTDAATELVRTTLEALGSTQIRNYCFQGSWAMIAIKGEGVARGEQLLNVFPPGPGPAIVTVSIPLGGGDPTPPTAPGQSTEDSPDVDADADGTYTVHWSAASDPESGVAVYELQERIGSGAWTTLSDMISGTSYPVTGRLDGFTYSYRVRAKNLANQWGTFSPVSDGVRVDTQAPQLSAIGVTGVTGSSADLNWTTDEPTTCTVDYGLDTSYGSTLTLAEAMSAHTATLNGLLGISLYHFEVHCEDVAGNTVQSGDQTFTTTSPGPSVITIQDRQLLLQKRNLDGTLEPATPYIIRGVNWSPASTTTNTWPSDSQNAVKRRPEFGNWYATDIPLMAAMNVNTARVFIDLGLPGDPGVTVDGLEILNEFYRNGIMVIMTVDDASNQVARISPVVNYYKDHPAILAWSLGSEWNINRYFRTSDFPTVLSAAQATEQAAQLIKSLDTNHAVATSYGEIDINATGLRLADTQQYVNDVCPSVDVWGLNIYRGKTFGALFTQWASISSKPIHLGEFGIDAFHSTQQTTNNPLGSVNEAEQADWDGALWDDIVRHLSADDPSDVAIGGTVFEWNDEWWKVSPQGSQQTGGWLSGAFPDGVGNEEYFGIVTIDRVARQVYATLQNAFRPDYVPPPQTVNFKAVSRGANAAQWSSQYGFAKFFKDSTLLYSRLGGGGGGRGFNVATVDPSTGELLGPVTNYDTWITRSTGTAMNAMIADLNALPNGTLILFAVADDAGLTLDNSCTHRTSAWTESGFQALEALGSTQIRDYCFRYSWAMATVKGEGTARAEQVGNAIEVTAETTLQVQP